MDKVPSPTYPIRKDEESARRLAKAALADVYLFNPLLHADRSDRRDKPRDACIAAIQEARELCAARTVPELAHVFEDELEALRASGKFPRPDPDEARALDIIMPTPPDPHRSGKA